MTPEDIAKAYSFDQDVRDLIQFWLGQSIYRWQVVQTMGGYEELLQEAAVRMLVHRGTAEAADCKWTTYVINNVKWSLWALTRPPKLRYRSTLPIDLEKMAEQPEDAHLKMKQWAQGIYDALDRIPNQHAASVAKLRFVEGRNMRDVGRELGISHQRVRQLCEVAFKQLRKLPNWDQELVPYDK